MLTPRSMLNKMATTQEQGAGIGKTILRKLSFRKKKKSAPSDENAQPENAARSEEAGTVTLEHVASLQVQLDLGVLEPGMLSGSTLNSSPSKMSPRLSSFGGGAKKIQGSEAKAAEMVAAAAEEEAVVQAVAQAKAAVAQAETKVTEAVADAKAEEAEAEAKAEEAEAEAKAAETEAEAKAAEAEAKAKAAEAEAEAKAAEAEAAHTTMEAATMTADKMKADTAAAEAAAQQENGRISFEIVHRAISAAVEEAERSIALQRERAISAVALKVARAATVEALASEERERIGSELAHRAIAKALDGAEREAVEEIESSLAPVVERAATMAWPASGLSRVESESGTEKTIASADHELSLILAPTSQALHTVTHASPTPRLVAGEAQAIGANLCVALRACFTIA